MSDEPKADRLDLRGTLDLIFQALRTAGTANATGAITAGASYRFFADKPDLQWAIKQITVLFLFGVLTFACSYIALFIDEIDHSLGRSAAAQGEWEHIVWSPPQNFLIALLFGFLSIVFLLGGLGFVMNVVLFL
jgi:hypothetical protein